MIKYVQKESKYVDPCFDRTPRDDKNSPSDARSSFKPLGYDPAIYESITQRDNQKQFAAIEVKNILTHFKNLECETTHHFIIRNKKY